ncbi:hypothetical protein BRD56_02520 [Thermoplasmatales archaeon SW_10_69_26]|nr:MAG: hypothetical protein BRD56_02520 [Thermoplasmatales archaeon SW_10_69_26]
MPAREEYEPAGTDKIPVDAVKLTRANSAGVARAPSSWEGARVLVLAGPSWWEVVENPDGITVEWESGEKATEQLDDELKRPADVYVGRAFEDDIVVLAKLP